MCFSPCGPKCSQFHAGFYFLEKLAKSYVGAPGGLAPPHTENPGSAPAFSDICYSPRNLSVWEIL